LNQEKINEDFEIKLFKICDKENISPIIIRECANKILEDIKEEQEKIFLFKIKSFQIKAFRNTISINFYLVIS